MPRLLHIPAQREKSISCLPNATLIDDMPDEQDQQVTVRRLPDGDVHSAFFSAA